MTVAELMGLNVDTCRLEIEGVFPQEELFGTLIFYQGTVITKIIDREKDETIALGNYTRESIERDYGDFHIILMEQ